MVLRKENLGKSSFPSFSSTGNGLDWPSDIGGLPPMHYATHCVGPVFGFDKGFKQKYFLLWLGVRIVEFDSKYGSSHIRDRNLSYQV